MTWPTPSPTSRPPAPGTTCEVAAGNQVECDLQGLAPAADPVAITVTGNLPADFTGSLPNTATVSSPTDTTPGNNSSTVPGDAQPAADVTIAKSRTSGPVVPGQQVTWSVVVTNSGPSTARDVTVSDDVVDDLTSVTVDGATCDPVSPDNEIQCALGALAPGDRVVLTISGDVPPDYTGALDNTATVASPTDTSPGDNDATSTGTAQPAADVSVDKARTSGPVVPGNDVTWTVTVANGGPSTATGVSISDDVADALTGVTATGPGGTTCEVTAGNQVDCDLPDIGPGDEAITVTITGTVPAGFTGELDNTATVTSPTDTTPGNNSSTVPGAAQPDADVTILKQRTSGTIVAGESVTWTITARNEGPSVARSVEVDDDVDDALTSVTASIDGAPDCPVTGDNEVACDLGDLQPGTAVVITLTADVPAGYTSTLDNAATISSPTDTTPGNNTSTSSGAVDSQANVSIVKARASGPVVPGQPVVWTLTVDNAGPSVATGVEVSDDVVNEITGLTATGPAGVDCVIGAGNQVECSVPDLDPAADPIVITLRGDVPAGFRGDLSNEATISSPTDIDPGDNTSSTEGTAVPEADVSITKSRTSGTPVPGQSVSWLITVDNAGPSTARGVTVNDNVIDALTGVEVTSSADEPGGPAACSVAAGNRVSCELDTLAPSADAVTIRITGDLPAGFTGSVDNTATVASPTDTTPGNNSSSSPGQAEPSADVSVTKARTSGAVTPGAAVTWQITVDNGGPSRATDVVVEDEVPDVLTDVTATGPDGVTCDVAVGNEVSCDLGGLAPTADAVVLTISGELPAGYTGDLDNTATVASPTDTTPDNNSSTSTGVAVPAADVAIVKSRTSGPVVPGTDVTWQLSVTNDGPSTARAITVTDDVDDSLTGVTASGPTGVDCAVGDGGVVECDLGDLAPGGGPVMITVSGGIPADYTGTLANTGEVASPTDDTPDNNTSQSSGVAQPAAGVSIVKARTSGPVVPGNAVSWTLTVDNAGPSTARSVTVADAVPDALADVEVTAPDGVDCEPVGDDNQVDCDLGDVAPSADPIVLTVTGDLPADYTGALDNTATVASPTDTSPGDNTSTSEGVAQPQAAVSVAKERTTDPVVPGEDVTWEVTVTNDGPSTAQQVGIEDDVLDALTGVTATGPDGTTCDVTPDTNEVACDLGAIDPSDPVVVTITGALPAGFTGAVDNTVTVASPTDVTPDDNSATAEGTAEPQADLTIAKAIDDATTPPVPGERVSWTLTVGNDGPSVATAVEVSDALDPAVSDVRTEAPDGVDCAVTGSDVACALGALAPDADPVEITVSGLLAPDFRGSLPNTASIASAVVEADPDDNTAEVSTEVEPRADLSVAKEVTPEEPNAGEELTYRITVTNDGPSSATDVTMEDPVDTRLQDVDADAGSDGACDVGPDNVVECTFATIAAGADSVVTVTGTLPTRIEGAISNTATVTPGPEADPDGGDLQATATTGPIRGADLQVTKRADARSVDAGESVSYRITVSNTGPATARSAQLVDRLPDGLRATSATGDDATCSLGRVVRCDLGDVAAGDVRRVVITVDVASDVRGEVVNTATVRSATTDPAESNNADASPITVTAPPAPPGPVGPGGVSGNEDGDGDGLGLPDTGADAWLLWALAAGLLLLLLGALLLVRRARSGPVS